MPNFFATNYDVTSYLSKRDVARMVKADPNSPFIRMSVHTDRNNEGMVLVRRPDMITGKPVLQWTLPENTTDADALVLKVETITYTRNAPMGATALDGVNRWFESVDSAFVAVRRETVPASMDSEGKEIPATRNTVIDTFMRFDRVNKNFVTGSVVPLRFAESNEDLACWSDAFLSRLDANTTALDHRVKDWTKVTVAVVEGKTVKTKEEIVTAFGMFALQRERDAAARKKIEKSA